MWKLYHRNFFYQKNRCSCLIHQAYFVVWNFKVPPHLINFLPGLPHISAGMLKRCSLFVAPASPRGEDGGEGAKLSLRRSGSDCGKLTRSVTLSANEGSLTSKIHSMNFLNQSSKFTQRQMVWLMFFLPLHKPLMFLSRISPKKTVLLSPNLFFSFFQLTPYYLIPYR